MEILSGVLNKEHKKAGLSLEQELMPGAEDDLICLKRGEKVLVSWPGRQASVVEVIRAADNNLCPIGLDRAAHCDNCFFSKDDGTGKELCDWPHGQDGSTAE